MPLKSIMAQMGFFQEKKTPLILLVNLAKQKIIHFIKSVFFLRMTFFIHITEYIQIFEVSLLLLREILDFDVKRLSSSIQTYATGTDERCYIPTKQLVVILDNLVDCCSNKGSHWKS